MSTIIVTGATGFLGGVLARRLVRDGHKVVAMGRDSVKLAALAQEGMDTRQTDLGTTQPEIPMEKADALVHCAALSSPWGRRTAFEAANVDGTRTAIQLAREGGARRFVHISTPSLYFRFEDQDGMREDAALPPPVNHYAATKADAEKIVLAATDLDPVILRPRGIYGKGDTALLPRMLRAATRRALPLMRNGAAATDLTHVDDVVDAIAAALSASGPSGRVYNVSGGEPVAIRDVVERAAAASGQTVRWRNVPVSAVRAYARAAEAVCRISPGHPEPPITEYGAGLFAYRQTLDISAIKRDLGWHPAISFNEGLRRTFV